jgi:hypothetical protein
MGSWSGGIHGLAWTPKPKSETPGEYLRRKAKEKKQDRKHWK